MKKLKTNFQKTRNRKRFVEAGGQDGRYSEKVVRDKKKFPKREKEKNWQRTNNEEFN